MPNGQCHLCGSSGPLTFEHVPPSAAFNDHRVLEADIHKLIGSDLLADLKNPTGKYNQRGSGKFTLCRRCNNDTGGWYGRAYVEFAHGIFVTICDIGSALIGDAKPAIEKRFINRGLTQREPEGQAVITGDFVCVHQSDGCAGRAGFRVLCTAGCQQ